MKYTKPFSTPVTRLMVYGLLSCTALLLACSADDGYTSDGYDDLTAPLTLKEAVPATRAVSAVTAETYAEGDTIGITLIGADTPADYNYSNVKYKLTANNEDDPAQLAWLTDNDISLRRPAATLTAYFPYRKDISINTIGIDSADDIDWMYYPWSTFFLNARYPDATLYMLHAQAILRVQLRREGYGGDGYINEITITSPALALKGTLNATDGSYSTMAGSNTIYQAYSEDNDLLLPVDAEETCTDEWFFLPTTITEEVDITFTVTVDKDLDNGKRGRTLTVSTTVGPDAFQRGKIHLYKLKVMNSELTVEKVIIIPWETQDDTYRMKPTN